MTRLRYPIVSLVAASAFSIALGAQASAEEEPSAKALVRQGARLWGPYCGSCHNARPAGERSPGEWDTILLHMRVRGNIPGNDARALLEFLKAR